MPVLWRVLVAATSYGHFSPGSLKVKSHEVHKENSVLLRWEKKAVLSTF